MTPAALTEAENRRRTTRPFSIALLLWLSVFAPYSAAQSQANSEPKFEISFPAAVSSKPVTGRVFVIVTRKDTPEPRLQVGDWNSHVPVFGADIEQLQPGQPAVIAADTL